MCCASELIVVGMSNLSSLRRDRRIACLYRALSDLESGTPRQTWFLALARAADQRVLLQLEHIPRASGIDRLLAWVLPYLPLLLRWLLLRSLRLPGLLPYRLSLRDPFPAAVARVWPRAPEAMLLAAYEALLVNLCLMTAMGAARPESGLAQVAGMACLAFGGVYVALRGVFRSVPALAQQNRLLRDEPLDWSAQQEEAGGDLPEWLGHVGVSPERAAALLLDPDRFLDEPLCRRLNLVPSPQVRPMWRGACLLLAFSGGALAPIVAGSLAPVRYRLLALLLAGIVLLPLLGWQRARLTGGDARDAAVRSALAAALGVGGAYLAGSLLAWLFGH